MEDNCHVRLLIIPMCLLFASIPYILSFNLIVFGFALNLMLVPISLALIS